MENNEQKPEEKPILNGKPVDTKDLEEAKNKKGTQLVEVTPGVFKTRLLD